MIWPKPATAARILLGFLAVLLVIIALKALLVVLDRVRRAVQFRALAELGYQVEEPSERDPNAAAS